MTVYLDIVLLENLCMNYIILFATGYIMKLKMKQLRLVLSAMLGGIYAVIAYIEILPIYSSFGMKILLSVLMVYIAYNSKNIKNLLKQLVVFYLISFAFGGSAFALLYFVRPQDILIRNGVYVGTYPIKIALLRGIVGFILTYIAFKVVKTKLHKKDIIYNIEIHIKEKTLKLKAMLDTGNMLKDPISGMPVIVVTKEKLYSILPEKLLDNIDKTCLEKLINSFDKINDNKISFLASTVYGENGEAMNVPQIDTDAEENGYQGWYRYLENGIVRIKEATFVSLLINYKFLRKLPTP